MTLALAVLASLGGALATSASAAPGAPIGVTASETVTPIMHRRGMMHRHHMRHHRMMHRRHMMRRHMMRHRMERRMMRRM